jgi:hypothetical protein
MQNLCYWKKACWNGFVCLISMHSASFFVDGDLVAVSAKKARTKESI